MKHFFYTILLVASLGTVGAIMNPALVQQGAALIGLELPKNSDESGEKPTSEDQLAKFLEQYPFANHQNSATIPTTIVPTVVVPEPTSAPIPPFQVTPATSFPTPIVETPAPTYAHSVPVKPMPLPNRESSNWDSEAAIPIYPPPAMEYHVPQEIAFVPQQSIYIPPVAPVTPSPPQDVFPIVNHAVPSDFAQTRHMPPVHAPLVQPQPIQSPMPLQPTPTYPTHTSPPLPVATSLQTPAVSNEEVPVHGTEMVARVGTQWILMGDILPKIRRMALKVIATNLEKMSEEKRAEITRQEIEKGFNEIVTHFYPDVLQEQILFALVYSDYLSQQAREQRAMFDERLGEEFDRKEIPEMLKEFNVENEAALKRYLERQLGSSLEKERRLWIREQIVRQWIGVSIQRATGDATQDEMMEFYERNQAMFTSTAKARWQEMVVLFSRHNTEREAESKMRWMGNQVANGTPFEIIARTKSDGFTAPDGGVWDWTTRGSLTSAELERAIFSQPIGQLSPAIIRSDRGFHIIRVLEREEAKVVPFIEAQVTIRERIKNQRTQQYHDEYLANLRRRFPPVIVRDRIDFDINHARIESNMR